MENSDVEGASHRDDPDLHTIQLQALWAELKTGLREVVQEVSTLQQSNSRLEEKVSFHQRDTHERILSLRDTVNTLQEDVSTALVQISEISCREKELQRDVELLHNTKLRKFSRGEELVDGHTSLCNHTERTTNHNYTNDLATNQSENTPSLNWSAADYPMPGDSSSEHEGNGLRNFSSCPVWRDGKDRQGLAEQNSKKSSQRQIAALELLESERVYVSHLSLLLKANIIFNSCENPTLKDKRLFPSSLRFLIQQHLELLPLLQKRVFKSKWQGIMGDVFLRLSNTESDFLEHYVCYLKELPECLSVITTLSVNFSNLMEGDITGVETCSRLPSLLFKPVQRIPEYLVLLQSLLRHTEVEHPDYYLLLVCVRHLRSFTSHHHHLLHPSQDVLTHTHPHTRALRDHTHNMGPTQQQRTTHTHKELNRSSSKQSYEGDYESTSNYSGTRTPIDTPRCVKKLEVRRYPDWDVELHRSHPEIPPGTESHQSMTPTTTLHSIPEMEGAESSLADPMGAFLLCGGGDSHGSSPSHSSDSSIDITFVRCNGPSDAGHQSHGERPGSKGGLSRSSRGCGSPDPAMVKQQHPLQALQRNSKSLNGLQLDSVDSHHVDTKLETQSSAKLKLRPCSSQCLQEAHTDMEEQKTHKPSGVPVWEDIKWKGVSEESDHTPLSEHNRKEGKGLRNSFKKLFKKKSSGDKKLVDKVEGQSCTEAGHEDRGTSV